MPRRLNAYPRDTGGNGVGPKATSTSRLVTPEIVERSTLARRVVTAPTEEPKSAAGARPGDRAGTCTGDMPVAAN